MIWCHSNELGVSIIASDVILTQGVNITKSTAGCFEKSIRFSVCDPGSRGPSCRRDLLGEDVTFYDNSGDIQR